MATTTETCGAQHYWYENGVQRAEFCGKPATHLVTALGSIRWLACDECAADAAKANLATVTPLEGT